MFSQLRIGSRLMMAFGIVVLLNMVEMGILWSMSTAEDKLNSLTQELLEQERLASEWAGLTRQNGIRTLALLSTNDAKLEKLYAPQIKATSERISAVQKKLDSALTGKDQKAFAEDIAEKRKAYTDLRGKLTEEKGAQSVPMERLETELVPVLESYSQALEKYSQSFKDRMDAADHELQASNASASRVSVILAILTLSLSAAIVWFMTRSITVPLGSVIKVAEAVATGKLNTAIEAAGRAETGQLLRALSGMQENLRGLVGQIRDNASALNGAAQKLVVESSDMAAVSLKQSDSASAMAASVEELTVSIASVAANAQSACQKSAGAGAMAEEGSQIISETVAEMSNIAQSIHASSASIHALEGDSQQIEAVVGVIRDIADQTNLLALNAAIEAARAGESGRGFAVVADEVRKLAERTSNSTGQINATIEKIRHNTSAAVSEMEAGVATADVGVSLAGKAGASIAEITNNSKQVVDAVNEISATLQEQNSAGDALAANLETITHTAESHAAVINQVADDARNILTLAQALENSIKRFSL